MPKMEMSDSSRDRANSQTPLFDDADIDNDESRIINPPSRHQSTASPPQSTTLITQNGHVSMSGSAQQQQEQTSANPPVTVSQDQELFVRVFWFGWRSMNVGQLLLSLSVISTGLTVVFIYGSKSCYPLMLRWLTVQISLAALQFITSIIILTTVPSIYDTEPRAVQRARRATIPFAVSRFVTSAFVGWQMVGIASIGIAPDMECIKQRPPGDIDWVYTASYFNVIVNVSLLMIYAAFWLCIPCAIMLYYAQDPDGDDESAGATSFFTLSNRRGASQEIISRLPRSVFDPKLHDTGCAICLTDYSSGEAEITRLSCGHSFHYVCVISWLLRNAVCPQCRMPIQQQQQQIVTNVVLPSAAGAQSSSSLDTLLQSPLQIADN